MKSLHVALAVAVVLGTSACGGSREANGDAGSGRDGSATGGDGGPGGPVMVSVWQTDATQDLAPQPPIAFAADAPSSLRTIDIDDTITYQTIDGFGAAMTDSSAWLIETRTSAAQRDALMTNLFDPVRGAGLSFLRVPIGASDFHVLGTNATDFCTGGQPYSYDDNPPGGTDATLAHFSIDHDLPYIIPPSSRRSHTLVHQGVQAEPEGQRHRDPPRVTAARFALRRPPPERSAASDGPTETINSAGRPCEQQIWAVALRAARRGRGPRRPRRSIGRDR